MSVLFAAGVDEAGRGPLAGPVYAAAVILNPLRPIRGLRDSKVLSAKERQRLVPIIQRRALCWSVAWADVDEIEVLNILGATLLAMRRAICQLSIRPDHVHVDGNRMPFLADRCEHAETVIGGDACVKAISAASILAKQARDQLMPQLDAAYPGYCMIEHKGYATERHLQALRQLGPSPQHRRWFGPVQDWDKCFE
jgi:ribonuclease HII